MAKFAAVALGVVGVSGDDRAKYDEWKAAFGSNGGEEEFQVFSSNLRIIEEMQANDDSATYSHMTPFAAINQETFKTRNGYRATEGATQAPLLDVSNVAASYDWRDHGAVNAIKDQGQCGSCWAFSTVANLEGVGAIQTGQLNSFSEQQLVDCDTSDGGCQGGLPSNAFQFMIDQGMGLELESAYPYKAADGSCTRSNPQERAFISAWQQISSDESQIVAAVQQYGPLSIGINANTFQFYSGGVANPIVCNPAALDHGVAIVGFGTDNGQDYWTIRNSWGTSWGEAGYIRMVRGKGACGLNTDVTTATGFVPGGLTTPPPQRSNQPVYPQVSVSVASARLGDTAGEPGPGEPVYCRQDSDCLDGRECSDDIYEGNTCVQISCATDPIQPSYKNQCRDGGGCFHSRCYNPPCEDGSNPWDTTGYRYCHNVCDSNSDCHYGQVCDVCRTTTAGSYCWCNSNLNVDMIV